MKQSAHPFGAPRNHSSGEVEISIYDFQHWAESWVFDAQYRRCSKSTIENHQFIHGKVLWFCEHHAIFTIDGDTIRRFFVYLGGCNRWDNHTHSACQKEASRSTVDTYFGKLTTFFNWCVKKHYIDISPMADLDRPLKSKRKPEPFSDEELRQIIKAAEKSKYAARDTAAIHLLLGTGLRVSEFCAVQCYNVDWDKRTIRVIGKGDKERVVRFGIHTRRLLYDYAKTRGGISGLKYLFLSERGEPFTRFGVTQMIKRLGVKAGMKRDRICAHTLRHTFAVKYLIDGGDVFALMELMGHETLEMTNKYVKFSKTYLELQNRQHAPDDALYR